MGQTTSIMRKKSFMSGYIITAWITGSTAFAQLGLVWDEVQIDIPWNPKFYHTSVVFDNKLWQMCGGSDFGVPFNDVYSSTDGSNYNFVGTAQWSNRLGHTTVVFDDKMWVIGGFVFNNPDFNTYNDVWATTGGTFWAETVSDAPWTNRAGHTAVVFNDKIWIMGGLGGFGLPETLSGTFPFIDDIWSSSNGLNWVQEPAGMHWTARWNHASAVFEGRMYVIGGSTTLANTTDEVWSSLDGINWTQAPDPPWPDRAYHSVLVACGNMWIIGGENTSGNLNDVWFTSDGVNWNEATANADWTPRSGHASALFLGNIWNLGGREAGSNPLKEVWYSSPLELLSASRSGSQFRMTWQGRVGINYRVRSSTNFHNWILQNPPGDIAGINGVMSYNDTSGLVPIKVYHLGAEGN